jgi:hypothetical protein
LLATPADPKEAPLEVPHDDTKRINYPIMKQKVYPLLSLRVSLMTGRYPYQAGNTVLSRAVTVPEVLGVPNGGYTCLLCEG